jgi:spermidine synthase
VNLFERFRFVLALSFFALSGAIGLGYQVLWSKYLLDFIGVSAYSYATVLAAFMGGLALGSALLGRFADRARRPLLLFATLELAVGAYGLAYAPLQATVAALYAEWVTSSASLAVGAWSRAAAAGALLLPPAFLMGGTYPAVLRHLTTTLAASGRRASQAYAVNALGAAAGSLTAAFLLVPRLGMSGSLGFLALSSLAVASAAGAVALATKPGPPELDPKGPLPTPHSAEPDGRPERWVLPAILCAGLLAFALEIGWTRYLSVVLGSSVDSFAVMLSAFVGGIGLGSALLSRWEHRLRDPLAAWGWLQLCLAVVVLLSLPFLPYVPWGFGRVLSLFAPTPMSYVAYTVVKLAACLALMLPATLLLGMTLPLAIKGLVRSLGRLGRVAGRCYAWNTAGNVLGALGAGHLLMPQLGVEGLFRLVALSSALLGFGVVFARSPSGQVRRFIPAMALALLVVVSHVVMKPWPLEWFAFSPFRRSGVPSSFTQAREALETTQVLLYREDPAANIMVSETRTSYGLARSLKVNGKVEASDYGDMPTQVLVAHLPLTLKLDAQEVLLVGLASGITAGSVLRQPIERLDIVELIQVMPEVTRLFDSWNGDPLSDARAHLHLADAREFLSRTGPAYDVIISEPSNPWMAGVAGLFSVDFYAKAARRLEPDGVFGQWVQLYELDDEAFAIILASFRTAFPHVYAFQALHADLLLIGSRQPLQPDWDAIERRVSEDAISRDLKSVGVVDLASLLALQRLSPATIDWIADLAPTLNTDDNRALESRAPYHLFAGSNVAIVDRLDERRFASASLLWNDFIHRTPERPDVWRGIGGLANRGLLPSWLWDQWSTVLLQLQPDFALERRASSIVPLSKLAAPPPGAAALEARIHGLLDSGREPVAEELLRTYGPALLLESVLSPEHASLWSSASGRWAEQSTPFRVFRIELLMATGAIDQAVGDLETWFAAPPLPPLEWAQLRACAIGRVELCERVRRLRRTSASEAVNTSLLTGTLDEPSQADEQAP